MRDYLIARVCRQTMSWRAARRTERRTSRVLAGDHAGIRFDDNSYVVCVSGATNFHCYRAGKYALLAG